MSLYWTLTFPECVELIRNVVLTLAAATGAIVAWKGLNAWKEENRWQVDHELATKIYRAFAQRRAIYHHIRSPYSNPPLLSDKKIESKIWEARENGERTQVLMLYWLALKDIEISQAEIFDEGFLRWDQDFRKMSEVIRDLEYELRFSLDDQHAAEQGEFEPDTDTRNAIEAVISSQRDKSGRKAQYEDCFKKIEAVLKPKIVDPSLRGRTK